MTNSVILIKGLMIKLYMSSKCILFMYKKKNKLHKRNSYILFFFNLRNVYSIVEYIRIGSRKKSKREGDERKKGDQKESKEI